MTSIHTIHRRRAAAVAAVGLAVLAGCSSNGSSSDRSSSGVSATASASPPGATATGTPAPSPSLSGAASIGPPSESVSASDDPVVSAVLVAYRGYWAARVKALATPERLVPAELEMYAIDKARTDVKASVLEFRQEGIAFRGEPVLSPVVTVTSGAIGGAGGTASVVDCVDSSHWTPVFVDTGTSALAPGQRLRVVVESTARTYENRWVIVTSVAHRDRPC